MMTTGWQIYKYYPGRDECFVHAGLHNWFWNFEDAVARKESLERAWSRHGIQYVIVRCGE